MKRTQKKYIMNPKGKDKKKYLTFPLPHNKNNKINFLFCGLHKQKNFSLYEFNRYLLTFEKSNSKLFYNSKSY